MAKKKIERSFWEIIDDCFKKNVRISPKDLAIALREGLAYTDCSFSTVDNAILGAFGAAKLRMVEDGTAENGEPLYKPVYLYRKLKDVKKDLALSQGRMDGAKYESYLKNLGSKYDETKSSNVFSALCLDQENAGMLDLPTEYHSTFTKYFKACVGLGEISKNPDGGYNINFARKNIGEKPIQFKRADGGEVKFIMASLIDSFSRKVDGAIEKYAEQTGSTVNKDIADTVVLLATALTLDEITQGSDPVDDVLKAMIPFIGLSITDSIKNVSNKVVKDIAVELANQRVEELNGALDEKDKYFKDETDRTSDLRHIFHDYALKREIDRPVSEVDELRSSYDSRLGMFPFMLIDNNGDGGFWFASDMTFENDEEAKKAICCEDHNISKAFAAFQYFQKKIFDAQTARKERIDSNPDTFAEIAEILFTNLLIIQNLDVDEDMKQVYCEVFGLPLMDCLNALAKPEVRSRYARTSANEKIKLAKLKGDDPSKIVAKTPSVDAMYTIIEARALKNLSETGIVAAEEFEHEVWDETSHKVTKSAGMYGLFGRVHLDPDAETSSYRKKLVSTGEGMVKARYLPDDKNNPNYGDTVLAIGTLSEVETVGDCSLPYGMIEARAPRWRVDTQRKRDILKSFYSHVYDGRDMLVQEAGDQSDPSLQRSFTPEEKRAKVKEVGFGNPKGTAKRLFDDLGI